MGIGTGGIGRKPHDYPPRTRDIRRMQPRIGRPGRMKLLIIAQVYPPYPAVGAFRVRNIARAFRDAGHEVHVITERLGPGEEARRPVDIGVEIHTVQVGERYRLRVLRAMKRIRHPLRQGSSASASAESVPAPLDHPHVTPWETDESPDTENASLLKRFAIALLWLPDDEQRFIAPALRAARSIMPGTDLIYTSAPSWSTHIVGLLLRRRHSVRWAADFRDPWTDILAHRKGRYRTAVTSAVLRRMELAVLRRADHVVAVAARTRDVLALKLPDNERHKFLLVRNGVDVTLPPRKERFAGPFRIAYAGSFYDDRDPRVFLQGLARLHRRGLVTPANLRVDFAGSCRTLGPISIEAYVRQLGLDGIVEFHDWMPQSEARDLLARADLLLILARGMELQVPNKLYEYLGMRIPIFAYADSDGETAAVLKAIEGHFVVTQQEPEAMERALESALSHTPPSLASAVQEEIIRDWGVERQMSGLVDALAGGKLR